MEYNNVKNTFTIINLLNNNNFYNIDNISNLYKQLFYKINTTDTHKKLIFELWLNYITEHLNKTNNILNQCSEFLNQYDNSDNKINTLSNTEIDNIYKFLYIEKIKYNI